MLMSAYKNAKREHLMITKGECHFFSEMCNNLFCYIFEGLVCSFNLFPLTILEICCNLAFGYFERIYTLLFYGEHIVVIISVSMIYNFKLASCNFYYSKLNSFAVCAYLSCILLVHATIGYQLMYCGSLLWHLIFVPYYRA